jgi:TusA-related sulfurtransferase
VSSSPGPDLKPVVIDVRGLGCGSVLVRLMATVKQLDAELDVLVWTDDLGADEELPAWCRMTGQQFNGRAESVDGVPRFSLRLFPVASTQLPSAPPLSVSKEQT